MSASVCQAETASKAPCKRPVAPGEDLCAWHLARRQKLDEESFYGVLSEGELRVMHVAALLSGVEAEITALRVMIRHCMTAGHVGEARRCMDSLARLLRAKHELSASQEDTLSEALRRVLTTLGEELRAAEPPPDRAN